MRVLGDRRRAVAIGVAALAVARGVVGHLTLPLLLVVRGAPFLALLVIRPNEATVAIGATQARSGILAWPAVLAAAAVGAVVSDLVSYALGRTWGEPALDRVHRHSHRRFVASAVERAQRGVQRNAPLAVVLGRPTVITHGAVPVLAGIAAVPLRVFLPAAAAGAVVWAGLWVAGGAAVASLLTGRLVLVAVGVAVAALGVWLVRCLRPGGCRRPATAP